MCAAFAAGFLVFPTYPVYDSYYALLWGREILDGRLPEFDGFRVPTQHPLAIAAGTVLSLLGDVAERVWIALVLASLLWLVWGVYRLAAEATTTLVGVVAAVLVLTRFDLGFLAARGYVDVPYIALVVWAAVLEQRRPRRGAAVFALLGAAGLLRPEAWVLAALYWLRMAWSAPWRARVGDAVLAAAAPALWVLTDLVATGDPLFSLLHTSGSAEDLGRRRSLAELPAAVPAFLENILKRPVLLAAVAGVAVGVAMAPRRLLMPLVLLATGLGTFAAIAAAGLSVIERYLTVTAVALTVFAAVAVAGWTMLAPSRLRTAWMACAGVLAAAGAAYTAANLDLTRFEGELRFRGEAHAALEDVLRSGATAAALRCGPLTVPNHKLVPDARWILDLPAGAVQPRADPRTRPTDGPELFATSRLAVVRHAFTNRADPATIQVPATTHVRASTSPHYAVYVRPGC